MTTLLDIYYARIFAEAYLRIKFKGNNDEFYTQIFSE